MLKACTSLNLFSRGLSFHWHSIVNEYSYDVYIVAPLINLYAKIWYTDVVSKVFDNTPKRNIVPLIAIIIYVCSISEGKYHVSNV